MKLKKEIVTSRQSADVLRIHNQAMYVCVFDKNRITLRILYGFPKQLNELSFQSCWLFFFYFSFLSFIHFALPWISIFNSHLKIGFFAKFLELNSFTAMISPKSGKLILVKRMERIRSKSLHDDYIVLLSFAVSVIYVCTHTHVACASKRN